MTRDCITEKHQQKKKKIGHRDTETERCYIDSNFKNRDTFNIMGLLSFVEDTKPSEVDEGARWDENQPEAKKQEKPQTEKRNQKNENNGVTSLSYDQVNDNADELIELRGEGRYFGITDPEHGTTINAQLSLGPLCDNCHKRGHIRSKCKTVICHKCGVVGDHYELQCPTTMICAKCGQRGHMVSACTNKSKKREYCRHCDTFSHGDHNCPSIWRSYITKPQPNAAQDELLWKVSDLPVIYCYNCGDNSHYGDECHRQRSSRIPNINGSAFSGTNLPKHLRKLYNWLANDVRQSGDRDNNYGANGNRGYNYGTNGNRGNRGYQKNQRPLKSSKKDFNGGSGAQPTRSGIIKHSSTNKNGLPPIPTKANRSGVITSKGQKKFNTQNSRSSGVKPNRSGMLPKNGSRKNFQAFY